MGFPYFAKLPSTLNSRISSILEFQVGGGFPEGLGLRALVSQSRATN